MSPSSLATSLAHAPSMPNSGLGGVSVAPVLSASAGCPLYAHAGSIAAATAAASSKTSPCLAHPAGVSPRTAPLLHHTVSAADPSLPSSPAANSASPLCLRSAVSGDNGADRSVADVLSVAAPLKNAAAYAMSAQASPSARLLGNRLSKRGCCSKAGESSHSFLDAFQQALKETAAQARLEREGRDDAERRLEQLQQEVREKRREASGLQQQVASLLRRCDTLAVQHKQHADEMTLLQQQHTAKRVEASLLREEVHDTSRKMESLRSELDKAQQELHISRATLAKRDMENDTLKQQLASHRDKCVAFEMEIARLAQQMDADKIVTNRLKEQLHALFHAEYAAGEGLMRCRNTAHTGSQVGVCELQRKAAAERAAALELLLKRKNVKLTLKAQALQEKLEACQIKEAKNKIAVARLHEALEVEKLKNSEATQREIALQERLTELQQQQLQHQQTQEKALVHLKQKEALMTLSKQLGQADGDRERLHAEIRTKDALLAKLAEKEAQLQQQVYEGTQEVEKQRALNARQEEENLRLRDKLEEQSRRLHQQQLQHDSTKIEHEENVRLLTTRLQETSATLCEAKREATSRGEQFQLLLEEVHQLRGVHAATASLRERCETCSRLLRVYKKENLQLGKRCEMLLREVQLSDKRVRLVQDELQVKEKCLKEAKTAEETMRLALQQEQDGRSTAEEKLTRLEREKQELLLNWQQEWESQQQLIATLQEQQQQFEEELKLIKEEVEQRRLQHHEDIAALQEKLTQHAKKELVLQAELDQKTAHIRRLRASLDEHVEERAMLMRGEKRARDEIEEKLQLERQKCQLQAKDKSQLADRCELLQGEVQQLNRALVEAAERTRRCEELEQEKFHLQETLDELEKEFKMFENMVRVKEEEICTLRKNQREMHNQMHNERVKIEAMVPKLIDVQVKNKVSALQRKYQQKMIKLRRRLADRTQYEEKVREVVHTELQSLQRWNQEMEKWELLTRPEAVNPCPVSARGGPAELFCCPK